MTEALVVGAGPAGSIAALVLARAGVTVRLVDRATFPRDKLCGDTINPGSLALLDGFGLGQRVRAFGRRIDGMTVTGPRGAQVTADYPHGLSGASLTRRVLDQRLLDAAISAGVSFDDGVSAKGPIVQGDRVTGATLLRGGAEQPLSARMVIAADGRASRLGTALGLTSFAPKPRRWAFGAYFEGVADLSSRGEMHVRREGYIGIAPLSGGVANVCVVREIIAPGAVRRVIADAIAGDPGLRDRFADARQISDVSVLGPLAVEACAAGCAGLLLAGDAAGFVDPMTGDGLRFALRGGILAAEHAMRELETGRPQYAALDLARRREFRGKWRVNRALRRLVGSPRGVTMAAAIARRWDTPVNYLVAVAGDVALCPHSAPVHP